MTESSNFCDLTIRNILYIKNLSDERKKNMENKLSDEEEIAEIIPKIIRKNGCLFNQMSFKTNKKYNNFENESIILSSLTKEFYQRDWSNKIFALYKKSIVFKPIKFNNKIFTSMSNNLLQPSPKKLLKNSPIIGEEKRKKSLEHTIPSVNIKSNSTTILTDGFLVQTLNKLEKTGFLRQAIEFKDIIDKMKLREKDIRNFDLDLKASVIQTNNMITQALKTREDFKNTTNTKYVQNKIIKNRSYNLKNNSSITRVFINNESISQFPALPKHTDNLDRLKNRQFSLSKVNLFNNKVAFNMKR